MTFSSGWRSRAEGDVLVLLHGDVVHRFDIRACPSRYKRASHWREDGSCRCEVHRWPFEDLERWVLRGHVGDLDGSDRARLVAHALKISERRVFRVRARGGLLTDRQADELAIAAGLHPCLIWGPAWFATAPPELELESA